MRRSNDVFVGSRHISKQGCLFTVVRYNHFEDVVVEFNDSHRYRASFNSQHIKGGNIKNPFHPTVYGKGYIGSGKYLPKDSPLGYRKWKQMLERCYCPKRLAYATSYQDCEVCEEWLNFQNFANWFYSKPIHQQQYDLDKDLFGGEMKLYSPTTCTLLPRGINRALARSYSSKEKKLKTIRGLTSQLAMFVDLNAYEALMALRY